MPAKQTRRLHYSRPGFFMRWYNAAMSNARIERERLAHDVKLLLSQLAELDAEHKRKREELLRLFAKFAGKRPDPTPKSP
jgi:hypothetical protein